MKKTLYPIATIILMLFIASCSSSTSGDENIANIKDITEVLPTEARWNKIIEDQDITYRVTSNTTEDMYTQFSLMVEYNSSPETASTGTYPKLKRFAKADLNGDKYNELIFIGASENQPKNEHIYVWTLDYSASPKSLNLLELPSVPRSFMENVNGNNTYNVKPPYIERIIGYKLEDGSETEKSFLFKINEAGEFKLYSVDGELVTEVAL
ncbi:hypothetical protein [Peijinzhouia sedimentorum]